MYIKHSSIWSFISNPPNVFAPQEATNITNDANPINLLLEIFASSDKIFNQFHILKNFEQTIYPNRHLEDYTYIDLRVKEQVVVKEKFRKG